MPIDLSKLPKELINAAATRSLVPFIGAGVSRQAKGAKPLPNWLEFVDELAEIAKDELRLDDQTELGALLDRGEFPQAAQAIRNAIPPDQFSRMMERRFGLDTVEPGALHHALLRLRPPLIMTTNYDCLLEKACAEEFRRLPMVITPRSLGLLGQVLKSQSSQLPVIFKLHGSIDRPLELVLAEEDYHQLLSSTSSYRNMLSVIFTTKVVLMLGFSFSDPDLMSIMGGLRSSIGNSIPDYIVFPRGRKMRLEKQRLRRVFGLKVIEYEPSESHSELAELVEHLTSFVPAPATLT